jgi:hypothetical protein
MKRLIGPIRRSDNDEVPAPYRMTLTIRRARLAQNFSIPLIQYKA